MGVVPARLATLSIPAYRRLHFEPKAAKKETMLEDVGATLRVSPPPGIDVPAGPETNKRGAVKKRPLIEEPWRCGEYRQIGRSLTVAVARLTK